MEKFLVTDEDINSIIRAKQFENKGEWWKAREIYVRLKRDIDVQAINMIIESTVKGNEYRRKSKSVFEDFEDRKINKYQFHELVTKIHKEVYGY